MYTKRRKCTSRRRWWPNIIQTFKQYMRYAVVLYEISCTNLVKKIPFLCDLRLKLNKKKIHIISYFTIL